MVVPPGLLLAACCFFMKNPKPAPATKSQRRRAGLKDYLGLFKIPSYLLDTAGMAAMTFAIGGFSFWMPAYLHDAAHAGDLAKVNIYIAGVTATRVGGWLGDYMRRYTSGAYFVVSATGILISAIFIVLMVRSADTA